MITPTDDPTPSLHPQYRGFPATTGRSAGAPHNQGSALSRPPQPAAGRVVARLLTFRPGAADQAHVASMPDTAWPVSGHPPGSSRSTRPNTPVLMPSVFVTTRLQRFACARLPDPHLTSHWMPFPRSLTTTVFSQRSTRRFEASPRRAAPKGQFLHLPNSIIYHESVPTSSDSFRCS